MPGGADAERLRALPTLITARLLRPGEDPTPACALEISTAVTTELGKAFKPERIVFVSALPKTRSAKVVRRALRARVLGQDPGDLSSLENPDALEEIARAAG